MIVGRYSIKKKKEEAFKHSEIENDFLFGFLLLFERGTLLSFFGKNASIMGYSHEHKMMYT